MSVPCVSYVPREPYVPCVSVPTSPSGSGPSAAEIRVVRTSRRSITSFILA